LIFATEPQRHGEKRVKTEDWVLDLKLFCFVFDVLGVSVLRGK
jgi:hypothetical protein